MAITVQKAIFFAQITNVSDIVVPPVGNNLVCYKDAGLNACYKSKQECIDTCQTTIKHRAAHVAASEASKDATSNIFAAFAMTPPSRSS